MYTHRPSIKAFYEWRRRHGIQMRSGVVSRDELDRALASKATDRQMAKASLRNLKRNLKRKRARKERHAENV
jgi:multidrug resistance efflux pump